MNKYKIAVIGTGDMGKRHMESWELAGHEVVSVTDIDESRAKELARQFEVPRVYTDYKEAIASHKVDIVAICLPLVFHAPVTIFAAEQGKHVFCEKPLTRSMEDAEAMEKAVTKAGIQFGMGFQRCMGDDVELLQNHMNQGAFGRPLLLNSDRAQSIRKKLTMHDMDGNMGPIMDVCCHTFSYFQAILQSRPKTVYARGFTFGKDTPQFSGIKNLAIDTATITVEYESGDIASITTSWGLSKGHNYPPYDRIIGPKGGAFIKRSNSIRLFSEGEEKEIDFEQENLHVKQFNLFTDALDQGKPAPISIQAGKEVLAVTLASFESIETGKIVPVICDL